MFLPLLLLPLLARLLDLLPSLLLLLLPLVVLCSLVLASWLLVRVLSLLSFKVDGFLKSFNWWNDTAQFCCILGLMWGSFVYTKKPGLFVSYDTQGERGRSIVSFYIILERDLLHFLGNNIFFLSSLDDRSPFCDPCSEFIVFVVPVRLEEVGR